MTTLADPHGRVLRKPEPGANPVVNAGPNQDTRLSKYDLDTFLSAVHEAAKACGVKWYSVHARDENKVYVSATRRDL